MIVRSFLKWYESASAPERCEAVQMMAQTYLSGELGSDSPAEVEAALTLVLDDPALSVRRTLAWTLALSERAPRHILIALAHDHAAVSSLILARSPQLRDADLIDCLRSGDALHHLAIAMRDQLSTAVAAELAARGGTEALVALIGNPGAMLTAEIFRKIAARHADTAEIREALGRRDDLPCDVRQMLVAAVSTALGGFMTLTGWVDEARASRITSDARDAATIGLSETSQDLGAYVDHLRRSGQLTPSLLLRALLGGETALMGATLVALTGLAPRRVAGLMTARSMGPFVAAYHKAGLPRAYLPAFTAALEAIRDLGGAIAPASSLQRPIIQRVLSACLQEDEDDIRPVIAMLRRFDAEVARAEARAVTERLKAIDAATVLEAADVPMITLEEILADEPSDAAYAISGNAEVETVAAKTPADAGAEVMPAAAPAAEPAAEILPPLEALPINLFQERLAKIVGSWQAPRPAQPVEDVADAIIAEVMSAPHPKAAPAAPRRALPNDIEALFAQAFRSGDPAPQALVIAEVAPAAADDFAGWELRRTAA